MWYHPCTKPEVHRVATSSEEDPATAIGSMIKVLVTIRRVEFELRERTDRQTDRQTNILIAILRNKQNITEVSVKVW